MLAISPRLTSVPITPADTFLTDLIGNTPLVRLQRLNGGNNNRLYVKLEGNNPAGSVKDRPAYNMIKCAAARGDIHPGERLVVQ